VRLGQTRYAQVPETILYGAEINASDRSIVEQVLRGWDKGRVDPLDPVSVGVLVIVGKSDEFVD
jgi:hypothetical protein